MKILIVLPFIPLDRNYGGNQAVINTIEYLRTRCRLTITFPVRHHNLKMANEVAAKWSDVDVRPYKYWEDKSVIPMFKQDLRYRRSRKRILRARGKMLRSFFKHKVVSLDPADVIRDNSLLLFNESVQDSPLYFFQFIKNLSKEGFDIVQTEFFEYINLSYFLPADVRKVMVHHELRFVRLSNEVALFPDRRDVDDAMVRYAKDLEIAALRRFDDVIVLTENDRKLLEPLLPDTKVHCSPAAIPSCEAMDFKPCGNEFVFVGAMNHHPNLDGMLWFAYSVIPELRKHMSGFKVYVVGQWNRKFIRKITRACPEISFPGFVDDLDIFMNGKISIVPIRIGSGMRMKILDSINSMSPFVTTAKGVEGQDFMHGKECMVADSPEEFAQAMANVAGDETFQRKLAVSAHEKLNKTYNCSDILSRRLEIYEEICK